MDDNTLAGLPVPTKEKVTKWVTHIGIGAIAVAGIITVMPFVNHALSLLIDGAINMVELGLIGAGTCAAIVAGMTVWPLYKKLVASFANKATWALFEYDPVTPMMLWLQEARHDREELEKQYREIGAVIAQNQQTINDNLTSAKKADTKFAMAVKTYGQDSQQSKLMALEPGTLRETADRIRLSTEPLLAVSATLKEVVEATAFIERKAELDVAAFQQEFKAANAVERATNAATRVMRSRTEKKSDAMLAMKIIHDKYAGSFGRLQTLRDMSQDVITSVDMSKGTYHQDALERLRAESRLITGSTPVAIATPLPHNTLSFYSLQKK